jgi:hypothetical protein
VKSPGEEPADNCSERWGSGPKAKFYGSFYDGQQPHRIEKTGFQKRRCLREAANVAVGKPLLLGQELIADQAIGPEIRDVHMQQVAPRPGCRGNVYTEGRFPQHAHRLAIDTHGSDISHLAQIEHEHLTANEHFRGNLE